MFNQILLTGASGFVGSYVQNQLPCSPLVDEDGFINLNEQERVIKKIQNFAPDAVIHLAAQSFIPDSFSDPRKTFETNFFGTYTLLESLSKCNFKGKMLYVSSGDVYGFVGEDQLPATESTPLRPRSPYAVSKIAAEALCYQWSQNAPFQIVIARPFNHIGKGQSRKFAISDFAWQLVQIAHGKKPPEINVGDIDVTRDFTDVQDIVIAYKKLLYNGSNGEIYNVCSGKEYTIRSLIEKMMDITGIEARIVQEPDRFRKSEQRRMRGSYLKINEKTGWVPQIIIEESLKHLLNGWEDSNE